MCYPSVAVCAVCYPEVRDVRGSESGTFKTHVLAVGPALQRAPRPPEKETPRSLGRRHRQGGQFRGAGRAEKGGLTALRERN